MELTALAKASASAELTNKLQLRIGGESRLRELVGFFPETLDDLRAKTTDAKLTLEVRDEARRALSYKVSRAIFLMGQPPDDNFENDLAAFAHLLQDCGLHCLRIQEFYDTVRQSLATDSNAEIAIEIHLIRNWTFQRIGDIDNGYGASVDGEATRP